MSLSEEDLDIGQRNPEDKPKVRSCLLCKDKFESQWSGERICKRCKNTAAWKSGG